MEFRTDELSTEIESYLEKFEEEDTFSGPSLYFHQRTISLRNRLSTVEMAIKSDEFIELLYATLTSWGLHRMGSCKTKLKDFKYIKCSLLANLSKISELEEFYLATIPSNQLEKVIEKVWEVVYLLDISIAEAKIVAASKTLHHLLPNLVPPIDRRYTYRFFYDRVSLSIEEEKAFSEIFTRYGWIARENREFVEQNIDAYWNSSPTKIIDNALIGYCINKLGVNPGGESVG